MPYQVVMRAMSEIDEELNEGPNRPFVNVNEITLRIGVIQSAGVSVFASRELLDVRARVFRELEELQARGFAEIRGAESEARLTGTGELFAADLEWSDWARAKMDAAGVGSKKPA